MKSQGEDHHNTHSSAMLGTVLELVGAGLGTCNFLGVWYTQALQKGKVHLLPLHASVSSWLFIECVSF